MRYIKKENIITYVLIAIFVIVLGITYLRSNSSDKTKDNLKSEAVATDSNRASTVESGYNSKDTSNSDSNSNYNSGSDSNSDSDSEKKDIRVFVCGAVKNTGVYTLSNDSRVCDAIRKARGFKKNADRFFYNQAKPLVDGEELRIPTKKESKAKKYKDGTPLNKDEISGSDLGNSKSGQNADSSDSDKININTADKNKLMEIPGVGESKADAIINYRTENGNFKEAKDIMNIPGIKEGIFNKIKDFIEV
ncbi:MAG: helix-hairpin-helix domain-containing protein [Lachnospiraceae bacterium]|nr:helix-hairpin-helix domain-containing protein [Lachnospiraceae bacterium]